MAQLVVRNLDDSTKAGLRRRAERHGRSVEAEVQEILQAAAVDTGETHGPLGGRITARFARVGFEEEILEQRGTLALPATFE